MIGNCIAKSRKPFPSLLILNKFQNVLSSIYQFDPCPRSQLVHLFDRSYTFVIQLLVQRQEEQRQRARLPYIIMPCLLPDQDHEQQTCQDHCARGGQVEWGDVIEILLAQHNSQGSESVRKGVNPRGMRHCCCRITPKLAEKISRDTLIRAHYVQDVPREPMHRIREVVLQSRLCTFADKKVKLIVYPEPLGFFAFSNVPLTLPSLEFQ